LKYALLSCLAVLAACAPNASTIKHLGPMPVAATVPPECKIAGVMPGSPAEKAGLKAGDTIKFVNAAKPADAVAVADLIDHAGAEAQLDIADSSGKTRQVKVALNKDKPRLGASCDLSGWRKNSVSAAGNESITVFQGPYAVTFSGIVDKGVTFIRARISNHSDRPLPVSRALFSVRDAAGADLKVLSPQEVIYFMHGDDAVPMIAAPATAQAPAETVAADSPVRRAAPPHKKKQDWSANDESYVQANAKYLNAESLWPTTVAPGGVADGLIYFLEPKALPVTLQATLEGRKFEAAFGTPQPSQNRMRADDLINFFNAQKKGTPVRLTLTNGKVFVGKYSSYDSLNEIVWFDTPSGVMLTTSSFGLRKIASAEILSPESDKKTPAAEPVN
jgi:hypothetical protein